MSGIEANSPDAGARSRLQPTICQQKDTNKQEQEKIRDTIIDKIKSQAFPVFEPTTSYCSCYMDVLHTNVQKR